MEMDFIKLNEAAVRSMQKKQQVKPVNDLDKASRGFGEYLKENVDAVNKLQMDSRRATELFMLGELENVHDVTIAAEKAGLAMKTLLTVRKKVTDIYREITQIRL
jgi:flagellar hook-basal body complex protein FliE